MHSSNLQATVSRRGVVRILCGVFPILMASSLLLALIASVSPTLIEATSPETICQPAAGHTHSSVRQIFLSTDGQEAHVVRHPTHWQLIDIRTGAVQQQRLLAEQFRSAIQRIKTPENAAVYTDAQGCHLLHLWKDQPPVHLFSSETEIDGIAGSAESVLLAVRHLNLLQLWSMADGRVHASVELDGAISAMEWSPDGRSLLLLMSDGRLQSRDGETLELLQSQSTSLVGGGRLAWSSSGRHIAAYNQSGRIATWDLGRNVVECQDTGFHTVQTVAYSPNGDFLVIPDAFRDVWVLPTTGDVRERCYLGTAGGGVSALCLVNDGQALLVGTLDGNLECWSTVTGLPLWSYLDELPLSTPPINPLPTEMEAAAPFAQRSILHSPTRS